jgi:hypothetical protein
MRPRVTTLATNRQPSERRSRREKPATERRPHRHSKSQSGRDEHGIVLRAATAAQPSWNRIRKAQT